MRRLVIAGIVGIVGSALMMSAPSLGATFEVGSRFPDLVLPGLVDGQPMSIADFRGERVVLHVFASW